jgi:hypothetical protein
LIEYRSTILLRQGYAAHGGVFVYVSAWSWLMDKCPPDLYDVLGSLVIVAGVEIIMYWPRGRLKEGLAGQGKQFELKRRVISKRSFLTHYLGSLTYPGGVT